MADGGVLGTQGRVFLFLLFFLLGFRLGADRPGLTPAARSWGHFDRTSLRWCMSRP